MIVGDWLTSSGNYFMYVQNEHTPRKLYIYKKKTKPICIFNQILNYRLTVSVVFILDTCDKCDNHDL